MSKAIFTAANYGKTPRVSYKALTDFRINRRQCFAHKEINLTNASEFTMECALANTIRSVIRSEHEHGFGKPHLDVWL